jgi:hypothetical protein
MSTGPVWAIELDVNDCYPSFDGKKLASFLASQLLVPKEVSERVLISEYLNLKGGNISYYFGPAGDDPGLPEELEKTLADARQRIPQGSATFFHHSRGNVGYRATRGPQIGGKDRVRRQLLVDGEKGKRRGDDDTSSGKCPRGTPCRAVTAEIEGVRTGPTCRISRSQSDAQGRGESPHRTKSQKSGEVRRYNGGETESSTILEAWSCSASKGIRRNQTLRPILDRCLQPL